MPDDSRKWDGKPYYSLSYYLKHTYGQKIYKLALNGGFTCPNRDGTLGRRGCIFCSAGGSGDFTSPPSLSISRQINIASEKLRNKYSGDKYIAYFQAYTNTYAPAEKLRSLYMEAILHPQVAVLSIATRPDCLPAEVIELLRQLNAIKPVWIELGLQTVHEKTADFIRRGYSMVIFLKALDNLQKAGIETIVHTILGIPGETAEDMLETHRYLADLPIQGIKIQLLHILKGTDLNCLYGQIPFHVLTMEEYIDLVIRCVEILPVSLVIHRLTGDGPGHLLTAPQWSIHKKQVLNELHHQFKIRQTWQGRCFSERSC